MVETIESKKSRDPENGFSPESLGQPSLYSKVFIPNFLLVASSLQRVLLQCMWHDPLSHDPKATIFVYRSRVMRDHWTLFDLCIVFMAWLDMVVSAVVTTVSKLSKCIKCIQMQHCHFRVSQTVASKSFEPSKAGMQEVALLRLFRIARLARAARHIFFSFHIFVSLSEEGSRLNFSWVSLLFKKKLGLCKNSAHSEKTCMILCHFCIIFLMGKCVICGSLWQGLCTCHQSSARWWMESLVHWRRCSGGCLAAAMNKRIKPEGFGFKKGRVRLQFMRLHEVKWPV